MNEPAPADSGALIALTQVPVIVNRLQSVRADVEAMLADVDTLVCTEDTLRTVKARRSDLKKIFGQLEAQRKAVKAQIMAPYNELEQVYRECVGGLFERADAVLKEKIDGVESAMKEDLRERLVAYFEECRAAEGVEWLEFDQLTLKYGVTEARQKVPKALFRSIADQVALVRKDVNAINAMEDSAEIMVEYRRSLNLSEAAGAVMLRKKELERAREMREEWTARTAAEDERLAELRTEPVQEEGPEPAGGEILKLRFTVRATREKLKELKAFLDSNGYDYE